MGRRMQKVKTDRHLTGALTKTVDKMDMCADIMRVDETISKYLIT